MKIAAVICEYNPFHNGHREMLRAVRAEGAEGIAVIMSGSFTQRGDFAVFDKYIRAQAALQNGADVVIELPVVYACAGAERFAQGGVYIADALGCVSELAFGSECGNITLLRRACQAVRSEETLRWTGIFLSQGMTYAAARRRAAAQAAGEQTAAVLDEPNNILAVEYLKALADVDSPIQPLTVKRIGAAHDSGTAAGAIASASFIRDCLVSGRDYSGFVPGNTLAAYNDAAGALPAGGRLVRMEQAILCRLRMMTAGDFSHLPGMSEGLENRLYAAVREGHSVEEILSIAKCRRYPLSRLRRSLFHAFLGLTEEDFSAEPQYIKVIGFNERGRAILRQMKASAALPVIMKYRDVRQLSPEGKRMYETESRCDDLFALSGSKNLLCGRNSRESAFFLSD